MQINQQVRPLSILIQIKIMQEVINIYNIGINVNIYPGLSKVKYHIVDRLYLVIDSSQFEDGIPVLVVLTP